MVDEHPVAGADPGRDLPEAQVHDPLGQGVLDGGVEQPVPGLRSCHASLYHMVHEPYGTEKGR